VEKTKRHAEMEEKYTKRKTYSISAVDPDPTGSGSGSRKAKKKFPLDLLHKSLGLEEADLNVKVNVEVKIA
jgi:hypothetical protein